MAWAAVIGDAESWTAKTKEAESWTPKTQDDETWTATTNSRVFSPSVFAHYPIFDTGSSAGTWNARITQSETWADA